MRTSTAFLLSIVLATSVAAQSGRAPADPSALFEAFSSNGEFRLEVDISTSDDDSSRSAVFRNARLLRLKSGGDALEIWSRSLGDLPPGLAGIVTNDARHVVFVNDYYRNGDTANAVIVLDEKGNIRHRLGLAQILGDSGMREAMSSADGYARWLEYEPFVTADNRLILPSRSAFLSLDLASGGIVIARTRPRRTASARNELVRGIYDRVNEAFGLSGSTAVSIEARRRLSLMNFEIYQIALELSGMNPEIAPLEAIHAKMDDLVMEAARSHDSELFERLAENRNRGQIAVAQAVIRGLQTALEQYYIDQARYPDEAEGLKVLISGEFPLAETNMLIDPWGNEFIYRFLPADGIPYSIYSSGPDGQAGTADDVRSEW